MTRNFTVSDFYCTQCGNKGMPIPRKMAKERNSGHLKKLYCIYCKEDVNHIEIRSFDHNKEELLEKLMAEIKNGSDV